MADKPFGRIVALPLETQAQIRSTLFITSLEDVVLGLVKNALDASAQNITIHLDIVKGYCSVLDDGLGISPAEFLDEGGLGLLYHTNKHSDTTTYGRYGRFLASLANVAILSVASSNSAGEAHSVCFKHGHRILLQTTGTTNSDPDKPGTKVAVYDLFGRIPVRVKQRRHRLQSQAEKEKECNNIIRSLAGLLLASARAFSVTMLDACSGVRFKYQPPSDSSPMCNELAYVVSVFHRCGLVHKNETDRWRVTSAQCDSIFLRAFICLEPAPSKFAQFVSLGHVPMQKDSAAALRAEVNRLFDVSTFASGEHISSGQGPARLASHRRPHVDDDTSPRRHGHTKGVDRWPVFCIRINSSIDRNDTIEDDQNSRYELGVMPTLISLIRILISEFLQSHNLTRQCQAKALEMPVSVQSTTDKVAKHVEPSRSVFTGLDHWSRIKSTSNHHMQDMLSGLPFLSDNATVEPSHGIPTGQNDQHEINHDKEVLEWIDPKTRSKILLNARTGMQLPGPHNQHSMALATSKVSCYLRPAPGWKSISEAAKHIIPSVRSERPIAALTCSPTKNIGNMDQGISFVDNDLPIASRVTKAGLAHARVMGQVDGKFILASTSFGPATSDGQVEYLIMIDQHAADERIKLEQLLHQICQDDLVFLSEPIVFEVPATETRLFETYQPYLWEWQIRYEVNQGVTMSCVKVTALPELIVERCRIEPRLLIELLRKEVWHRSAASTTYHPGGTRDDWLTKVARCPAGVLNMLASRACRSAIMFNDTLSRAQCQSLVTQLSACCFPFQCAHGRPSMTCVARMTSTDVRTFPADETSTFVSSWKSWLAMDKV